jgi:hypothetical protein
MPRPEWIPGLHGGGTPSVPSWSRMLLGLLAVATVIKLYLAYTTLGTNDVSTWERFLGEAIRRGGLGLYRSDPIFNHPPFIVGYIRGLGQIADVTHVPFRFWLRAASSAADVGTFALVMAIARRSRLRVRTATLCVLALAPASIMVSGFHGNTDPVMVLFVVLAVYLAVSDRPAWTVGIAIGMAINIKFAAVIFVPAVFFSMVSGQKKTVLVTVAGLTVAVASMPYLLQDPALIERRVVGYSSIPGHWGVTSMLLAGPHALNDAYQRFAPAAIGLGLAILCFAYSRRASPPSLFLQCGVSAFAFMVFTPGFGIQYLAWLVPWVVVVAFGPALLWYVASGVFMFVVYTVWSGGFPWYYATASRTGDWTVFASIPVAIAWWATLVVLVAMLRRASSRPSSFVPARWRDRTQGERVRPPTSTGGGAENPSGPLAPAVSVLALGNVCRHERWWRPWG